VFAFAAAQWAIPLPATLTGYLFAWAENQVGAAMKTMKLGHIGAQRILAGVSAALPALVESALACEDQGFSNFNPASPSPAPCTDAGRPSVPLLRSSSHAQDRPHRGLATEPSSPKRCTISSTAARSSTSSCRRPTPSVIACVR
jgi:hypothetical protein